MYGPIKYPITVAAAEIIADIPIIKSVRFHPFKPILSAKNLLNNHQLHQELNQ